jgi:hypothetical protein
VLVEAGRAVREIADLPLDPQVVQVGQLEEEDVREVLHGEAGQRDHGDGGSRPGRRGGVVAQRGVRGDREEDGDQRRADVAEQHEEGRDQQPAGARPPGRAEHSGDTQP